MSQPKVSTRKMLLPVLSLVSIIAFLLIFTAGNSGCNNNPPTTIDTAKIMAIKCADCPAGRSGVTSTPAGVQEFYYFKIDSAVLVDSFFKKTSSPPFKKILFDLKITDYSDVPKSISWVGHGAKNNDDMIDYDPEELIRLTNKEPMNAENLLYSTLEFHRRKIENLVGANGTGKSYTHLIFIPYIETRNGLKYISYKVQKRPIDPNADEPTESLNPCPPFRPE